MANCGGGGGDGIEGWRPGQQEKEWVTERRPWGKLVKSKIDRRLKHSEGVAPSFCRQKGATGGSHPKKS